MKSCLPVCTDDVFSFSPTPVLGSVSDVIATFSSNAPAVFSGQLLRVVSPDGVRYAQTLSTLDDYAWDDAGTYTLMYERYYGNEVVTCAVEQEILCTTSADCTSNHLCS